MVDKVRWGVMGCASIADWGVLPGLRMCDLATLTAVASRSLPKAEAFGAKQGAQKAYGSYEELLADPENEVVYIPLPNGIHAEWSIKAMQAGKDVLCEKPIAMNAAEARQIEAVRQETGRLCIEAFAYRFNPVVAKAIEVAGSGVLGDLRFITTSTSFFMAEPDASNVRLMAGFGGGALYDVGCYAINAQRMLAGREPLTAWADMTWSDEFDVDVNGTAMLDFGDGLRGTFSWGFETSYGSPPSVSGTEGALVMPFGWGSPDDRPQLLLHTGDKVEEIHVDMVLDYYGEVQDMSEALRGMANRPRYVDEPLESNMRVIDACYKSFASGKPETV